MAILPVAVKFPDGLIGIPIQDLDKRSPPGGLCFTRNKETPKCATTHYETLRFLDFYLGLTASLLPRPERAAAPAARDRFTCGLPA